MKNYIQKIINTKIFIRRPLACFCLFYMVMSFIYVMIVGYPRLDKSMYARKHIVVKGYVEDKYVKEDKLIMLIKKASCCEFEDTGRIRDVGVVCYMTINDDDTNAGLRDLPEIGSYVMVEGDGDAFREATNFGEFDMRMYYASRGYHLVMYKTKVVMKSQDYSRIRQTVYDIKDRLSTSYNRIFNEADASVARAMVLGDKNMDSDIKELFQTSGIAHILSISGLHISIIGMGLVWFLRLVRIPNRASVPMTIIIMFLYYLMTGMSPSTLRAVIMFSLMLFSKIVMRTYDLVTSLAISALYLVIVNPYILLYSGFYLSFIAVFGIAVFSRCFVVKPEDIMVPTFISRKRKQMLVKGINSVISCVSVSFFTLPVLLYYYYEFPVYSILLNISLVPLMSVLLGFLLGVAFIDLTGLHFLAWLLSFICRLILGIYEMACSMVNSWPGNHIILGKPDGMKLFVFYGICIFIMLSWSHSWFDKKRYIVNVLAVLIALICLIPINRGYTITMLDVGQGDGILLQYDDKVYFFDGGSSSNDKLAQYQLVPALKARGIGTVDYWFVSHPDSDHCSGLISILGDKDMEGLRIKNIILPAVSSIGEDADKIIDGAAVHGIPISGISRGQNICYKKLNIYCLSPDDKHDYGQDVNGYSEVFLVSFGDLDILMTGDSTVESEYAYMEYARSIGIDLSKVDILKVAHHGSSTSSSQQLIDMTNPRLALISCGLGNSYGHPHSQVVESLTENGVGILRTDELGQIVIHYKKGKICIEK